jgi:orotate phosphoribosyltransferase-like protein
MFQTIFNKQHAIALREHGFSASEISEFLGCSKDWVYGLVKQKVNPEKRKELMQHVVENLNGIQKC